MTVRMFQPHDVRKAFQQAKLYESASGPNITTKTFPTTSMKAMFPKPNPIHKPPLNTNQRQPNTKFTP